MVSGFSIARVSLDIRLAPSLLLIGLREAFLVRIGVVANIVPLHPNSLKIRTQRVDRGLGSLTCSTESTQIIKGN